MRVLYHYGSGSNCGYLVRMLELCSDMFPDFSFTIVRPQEYLSMNQDPFDILIYQTFPDTQHPFKFDSEMASRTDNKFSEFKGVKVLHDSFDNGDLDAFSRMGNDASNLPRIKNMVSISFKKRFNVIFNTPPVLFRNPITDLDNRKRDVMLHCAFSVGYYPHRIREEIMEILRRDFSHVCNFTRIPSHEYREFLRRTQMSVSAPGTGPNSNAFYTMLLCGTLIVHEKTVDNHQLLPLGDLISGEDYVSFSVENLKDILDWLLDDPESRDRIRISGHRKFKEGYDIKKAAIEFHKRLSLL